MCESRIKRVLSARSFEEERGQREVFVLVAEEEDLLLARAVGCFVLERERERFCAFVVEKSSPISEAAASSSSFAGQIFFLLSSSARTFKKRREKEKNECIYIYIISMGRSLSSSRENNNNGQHGEKSSLLSSSGRDQNGKRDAQQKNEEESGESTFQYLSSILVSALALTGAVVGVVSVWQRCQGGNCIPEGFLLPGDHSWDVTT